MIITINVLTGNWFADGSPEIGKVRTHTVENGEDVEEVLNQYDMEDYFITDEDGDEISEYDLMCKIGW